MKKLFKFLIIPVLHLIRKFLIILKIHALPTEKSLEEHTDKHIIHTDPPMSSYDYFYNEELLKCYKHFKKYFKQVNNCPGG